MSADNYRILKKIRNYWYRSILGKKLTKCCHMATSGRKGLTWNPILCSNGYVVKRKSMNEDSFSVIEKLDSSSITQINDTSVTYGTSYSYIVVSLDCRGESESSVPTVICPRIPSPSCFKASTPSNEGATILLNWQPVLNSLAYHIYRRRADESIVDNPTLAVIHNSQVVSYCDRDVINTVKYIYKIACEDSAGVSSFLSTATGIPSLSAPNNLVAEPIHGNNCIILSWGKVIGSTGYKIWRSDNSNQSENKIGEILHTANTKYVDKNAEYDINYRYTVQAFDKMNKDGPKSKIVTARE